MRSSETITENDLYRFFRCQASIFKKYSLQRKNLTNAVKEREQILKALQLEVTQFIDMSVLSQDDATFLSKNLNDIVLEGFYSKSKELGYLDNSNTRPSYLVTLQNGSSFLSKRPEGAICHQYLSDEAQELSLKTIYDSIDENTTPYNYINAFKLMMQITEENNTYSDAIITLSNISNKEIGNILNKYFITAGEIIKLASKVNTTIDGYLRENWDDQEKITAMAYSDLSVLLRSTETFNTLMKTKGFLVADTQKIRDGVWGFSSDNQSELQTLNGKNYLGLIHTIFRNFFYFKGLKFGSPVDIREKLFRNIFKVMHLFIPMMIELMNNVIINSQ